MTYGEYYHRGSDGAWHRFGHGAPFVQTQTPHLPFEAQSRSVIESGPLVMAHYFTQFPRRINTNANDYYYRSNWYKVGNIESYGAGAAAWKANTAYGVNNIVTNPSGIVVKCTTAHTSTSTYDATKWVKNGTDHTKYGGFVRDIPLIEAGAPVDGTYKLHDMKVEVRQAIQAGLNGFTMDMLGINDPNHWPKVQLMYDAVDAVINEEAAKGNPIKFYICLMPDGTANGSTAKVWNDTGATANGLPPYCIDLNASADALASGLATFKNRVATYKQNGTMLVAPFAPNNLPSKKGTNVWVKPDGTPITAQDRKNFWIRVKDRMATVHGQPIDLWMCYVSNWQDADAAPLYDDIAIGHGRWGDRAANSVTSETSSNRLAPATCHNTYGKPWMHFGATMDSRPRSSFNNNDAQYATWESLGSRTFHGSWKAFMDGKNPSYSDFQQITTWNDYTEHAHICPSENNQYVWVDLNRYYSEWAKTGSAPVIVRDCLYIFHRIHHQSISTATIAAANAAYIAATPSLSSKQPIGQTRFSTNANGGTAIESIIEAYCFLTAPATIEFKIGTTVIGTAAAVQGANSYKVNMPANTAGIISARAIRSGATVPGTVVTTSQPVETSPTADDYHYRCGSSLRQLTGYTF